MNIRKNHSCFILPYFGRSMELIYRWCKLCGSRCALLWVVWKKNYLNIRTMKLTSSLQGTSISSTFDEIQQLEDCKLQRNCTVKSCCKFYVCMFAKFANCNVYKRCFEMQNHCISKFNKNSLVIFSKKGLNTPTQMLSKKK